MFARSYFLTFFLYRNFSFYISTTVLAANMVWHGVVVAGLLCCVVGLWWPGCSVVWWGCGGRVVVLCGGVVVGWVVVPAVGRVG